MQEPCADAAALTRRRFLSRSDDPVAALLENAVAAARVHQLRRNGVLAHCADRMLRELRRVRDGRVGLDRDWDPDRGKCVPRRSENPLDQARLASPGQSHYGQTTARFHRCSHRLLRDALPEEIVERESAASTV